MLVALVRESTLASDGVLFTVGFGNLGAHGPPASEHLAKSDEWPPIYGWNNQDVSDIQGFESKE